MSIYGTAELVRVAMTYPAIDQHAHPLLTAAHRDALDFEGLVSEASGPALVADAPHTVACFRAAQQLGKLYRLAGAPSWAAVKEARRGAEYEALCRACMAPTGIQCVLIDDGLGGSADMAEGYRWLDRFTTSPTKRIERVEVLAEVCACRSPRTMVLTVVCDAASAQEDLRHTAHRERHGPVQRTHGLPD